MTSHNNSQITWLKRNSTLRPSSRPVSGIGGGLGSPSDLSSPNKDLDWLRDLSSSYEDIQKKTYLKWINVQLKPFGDEVKSIEHDLRDGKRLLKLLEVVCQEPVPRPERGSMRIHQMANVSKALNFIEKKLGEPLRNIGNEDIVDGNLKITLGLIWILIFRLQMSGFADERSSEADSSVQGDDFSDIMSPTTPTNSNGHPYEVTSPKAKIQRPPSTSAPTSRKSSSPVKLSLPSKDKKDVKSKLLSWAQRTLRSYSEHFPQIQDFHRSWKNGLAFSALIHSYDANLMPDFYEMCKEEKDGVENSEAVARWRERLARVFEIAQESMGVPRLLDPEDLTEVETPDERSVMTYVSEFYRVLPKKEEGSSQKTTTAKKSLRAKNRRGEEERSNSQTPFQIVEELSSNAPKVLAEILLDDEEREFPKSPKSPLENLQIQAQAAMKPPSGKREVGKLRRETMDMFQRKPTTATRPTEQKRISSLDDTTKARLKAELEGTLQRQLEGYHPLLGKLFRSVEALCKWIDQQYEALPSTPSILTVSTLSDEAVQDLQEALVRIEENLRRHQSVFGDLQQLYEEQIVPLFFGDPDSDDAATTATVRLSEVQRKHIEESYELASTKWNELGNIIVQYDDNLSAFEVLLPFVTKANYLSEECRQVAKAVRDTMRVNRLSHETPELFFGASKISERRNGLDQMRSQANSVEDELVKLEKNLEEAATTLAHEGQTPVVRQRCQEVRELGFPEMHGALEWAEKVVSLDEQIADYLQRAARICDHIAGYKERAQDIDKIISVYAKADNKLPLPSGTRLEQEEKEIERRLILLEELKRQTTNFSRESVQELSQTGQGIVEMVKRLFMAEDSEWTKETLEKDVGVACVHFQNATIDNAITDLRQLMEKVQEWTTTQRSVLRYLKNAASIRSQVDAAVSSAHAIETDGERLSQIESQVRQAFADLDALWRASDPVVQPLVQQRHRAMEMILGNSLSEVLTKRSELIMRDKDNVSSSLAEFDASANSMLDKMNALMQEFQFTVVGQSSSLFVQGAVTPPTSPGYMERRGSTESTEEDRDQSTQQRTLDGLTCSAEDVELFREKLRNCVARLDQFIISEWKPFLELYAKAFSGAKENVVVDARLSVLQRTFDELESLRQARCDELASLDHVFQFVQEAQAIQRELEAIQGKLQKTGATTDESLHSLEARVSDTQNRIRLFHTNFPDLLATLAPDLNDEGQSKARYAKLYEALLQKQEAVQAWVEEVRVWFVEAERIRVWLEERSKIVESRPSIDPLAPDLNVTYSEAERLNSEHEAIVQEVESFNQEDMARLRAHVKALTVAQARKDLSPADTTTISITLSTLTILDHLTYLLRRRTYELTLLSLRTQWEEQYGKAVKTVEVINRKIKSFLTDNGRWSAGDCPAIPSHNDFASAPQLDYNELKRGLKAHQEAAVKTLLEIERSVSEFNQNLFSSTQDVFQEFDEMCAKGAPEHLESRQTALENRFEIATKRAGFVRQAVEQKLAVADYTFQVDVLVWDAEGLRDDLIAAERNTRPDDLIDFYQLQVDQYADRANEIISILGPKIQYPSAPVAEDEAENKVVNEMIRETIEARKQKLLDLGEELETALNALKRTLSLHKRLKQVVEEVTRLQTWLEKKATEIKAALDPRMNNSSNIADSEVDQLRVQHQDFVTELKVFEENELANFRSEIESLLGEISATADSTIDVSQIKPAYDRVGQDFQRLQEILHSYSQDIVLLQRRHQIEFASRSEELLSRLGLVRREVEGLQPDSVEEEHIERLEVEFDQLESVDLRTLQDLVRGDGQTTMDGKPRPRLSEEDLDVMEEKLIEVEGEFVELRHLFTRLVREAKNHRMNVAFFNSADRLRTSLDGAIERWRLAESSHGLIVGDASDREHLRIITKALQKLRLDYAEITEEHDELYSYYELLCAQDELDTLNQVQSRQAELEEKWEELTYKADTADTIVSRVGHWVEYHTAVSRVENEMFSGLTERVERLAALGWDAIESEVRELNERIEAGENMLASIKQAAESLDVVEVAIDLDDKNRRAFLQHYDRAIAYASDLREAFQASADSVCKASRIAAFRAQANNIRSLCGHQTEVLRSRCEEIERSRFYALDVEALEKILRNTQQGHDMSLQEYSRCKDQAETHLRPAVQNMEESFTGSQRVREIFGQVQTALADFSTALDAESHQLELVRLVLEQCREARKIRNWMASFKVVMLGIQVSAADTSEKEIDELEVKKNEFAPQIESFIARNNEALPLQEGSILLRCEEAAQARANRVLDEWNALQELLAAIRISHEKSRMSMDISQRVKELLECISELKGRVLAVQIQGNLSDATSDAVNRLPREKDAIKSDNELTQIETEVREQLLPKVESFDAVLVEAVEKDSCLVRQRAEIAEAVAGLNGLLESKRQQVGDALKIGKAMSLSDEVEKLLSKLFELIEAFKPKLRNPDLILVQQQLERMDGEARLINSSIEEKMGATREAATLVVDDWRVSERIDELDERWAEARLMIQEYRDWIRKARGSQTPPRSPIGRSRKTSSNMSTSPRSLSRTRPTRPASIATEAELAFRHTGRPTSSASRLSTRHSMSGRGSPSPPPPASRRTSMNVRRSRIFFKTTPNKYVADPTNELDVEIGKIVNECPIKIHVAKVNGEVGKYWFGEKDPKLCYCRILRSKMIMVRVGGGWVELSKFLKDHGSREDRQARACTLVDINTSSTVSPSSLLTPNSSQASSSSQNTAARSLTSPRMARAVSPGRVEGDMFLHTDENGVQRAVAMRKAGDREYTPIVKRKPFMT
ncbi:uncharacterized protein VTP21DRAFT_609 [Calcarisporiella thermophila]|uniref:uncharacterized protein n=1 Tax=Calcarisporiella thermophila TaxID=911321 RepID=UPI003744390C